MNPNTKEPAEILGNLIWRYIKFLIKKWKTIMVFSILGFILSGSIYFLEKNSPKYQSELVLTSAVVANKTLESALKPIQVLIENREYENLSQRLGLDPNMAQSIASMELNTPNEYYNIDGQEVEFEKNAIHISFTFHDIPAADNIQNALVKLIESNDFINNKAEQKRIRFESDIEHIKKQLIILDSLAVTDYNVALNSQKLNLDISSYSAQEINVKLQQSKSHSEYLLGLLDPVLVKQQLSAGLFKAKMPINKIGTVFISFSLFGILIVSLVQIFKMALNKTID